MMNDKPAGTNQDSPERKILSFTNCPLFSPPTSSLLLPLKPTPFPNFQNGILSPEFKSAFCQSPPRKRSADAAPSCHEATASPTTTDNQAQQSVFLANQTQAPFFPFSSPLTLSETPTVPTTNPPVMPQSVFTTGFQFADFNQPIPQQTSGFFHPQAPPKQPADSQKVAGFQLSPAAIHSHFNPFPNHPTTTAPPFQIPPSIPFNASNFNPFPNHPTTTAVPFQIPPSIPFKDTTTSQRRLAVASSYWRSTAVSQSQDFYATDGKQKETRGGGASFRFGAGPKFTGRGNAAISGIKTANAPFCGGVPAQEAVDLFQFDFTDADKMSDAQFDKFLGDICAQMDAGSVPLTQTKKSVAELFACPICFDPFEEINSGRGLYSTICGHLFCKTCLVNAVEALHSCPNCRVELSSTDIHPIFF